MSLAKKDGQIHFKMMGLHRKYEQVGSEWLAHFWCPFSHHFPDLWDRFYWRRPTPSFQVTILTPIITNTYLGFTVWVFPIIWWYYFTHWSSPWTNKAGIIFIPILQMRNWGRDVIQGGYKPRQFGSRTHVLTRHAAQSLSDFTNSNARGLLSPAAQHTVIGTPRSYVKSCQILQASAQMPHPQSSLSHTRIISSVSFSLVHLLFST